MLERIDASFAVSLLGWAEARRDLQLAFVRFGVRCLSLRGRWRGLHVVAELSAAEAPERVNVLVRFLEGYAASAGTPLKLARAVCTSASSSPSPGRGLRRPFGRTPNAHARSRSVAVAVAVAPAVEALLLGSPTAQARTTTATALSASRQAGT